MNDTRVFIGKGYVDTDDPAALRELVRGRQRGFDMRPEDVGGSSKGARQPTRRPEDFGGKDAPAKGFEIDRDRLKFARGGVVPGRGNRDSVNAKLTPGEVIVKKSAAKKNMSALRRMNAETSMTASEQRAKRVKDFEESFGDEPV